ncbi:MAG: glycosyltransferase family 2 protein [Planctomycetota bacterium]
MKFSIITPSFNSLAYLPRCAASVADQSRSERGQDVDIDRIVVDGGSTDGTVEWLKAQAGIRWVSEKDRGMYDAVNKGLKMAQGDIWGYINCDEQYLPGTLEAVADTFQRHPEADIVFGDMLAIRPDGSLVAFRKSYPLHWWYIPVDHLYVFTCALFYRRKIIEDGFLFSTEFRDVSDADFIIRLLRAGYRPRHLRRYLSVYTMTGANLSLGERAVREKSRILESAPAWVRRGRHVLNGLRLAEKLLSGAYFQAGPISYSIYGSDPGAGRQVLMAEKPSFRWRAG